MLGHELLHVCNRDILTSSVAAVMAGVITSVAQFLMFFGAGRDHRSVNPIALVALSLLAPLPEEPRLQNTAHLMIANPFRNARALFSTHPPMAERVQRLEGMARRQGQG